MTARFRGNHPSVAPFVAAYSYLSSLCPCLHASSYSWHCLSVTSVFPFNLLWLLVYFICGSIESNDYIYWFYFALIFHFIHFALTFITSFLLHSLTFVGFLFYLCLSLLLSSNMFRTIPFPANAELAALPKFSWKVFYYSIVSIYVHAYLCICVCEVIFSPNCIIIRNLCLLTSNSLGNKFLLCG